MKGFVPVTKQALHDMLILCKQAVAEDVANETEKRIDRFISREKVRSKTRRWYRLFILPKARFAFDEKSVKAYAAAYEYPMFEGDPFESINSDAKNSYAWIARLELVARSENAGEPILLDMATFMRISEPDNYYWARVGFYCSVPNI